jgi:hypothetical protein
MFWEKLTDDEKKKLSKENIKSSYESRKNMQQSLLESGVSRQDMAEQFGNYNLPFEIELLLRFLTDDQMNEVWKELAKTKYKEHMRTRPLTVWPETSPQDGAEIAENMADEIPARVYDCAVQALTSPDWTKTRTDMKNHFKKIATSARSFSEAIEDSDLDFGTLRFFPVDTLTQLLHAFSPAAIDAGSEILEEIARIDTQLAEKFFGQSTVDYDEKGIYDAHWGQQESNRRLTEGGEELIKRLSDDGIRHWFQVSFGNEMPQMSTLVNAVADAAENAALEVAKDPGFIVPKPNDASAKRKYVIRYLAMWFKYWFGGYLQKTLARVASVTLDDPVIGPEDVADATRNWKPPERPWRFSPYE